MTRDTKIKLRTSLLRISDIIITAVTRNFVASHSLRMTKALGRI